MKKKWLIITVTALIVCSIVGGITFGFLINKKEEEIESPINTISETAPHYYDGGLHKISVVDNGKKIVNNGQTEYKIVCSDAAQTIIAPLSQYLYEASGVSFKLVKDDDLTWGNDQKWIVVGSEKLFKQAGLSMPTEDLGSTGFHIVTKDNTVFIMAQHEYGLRNGIYTFLEYTVGYDAFDPETIVYNKSETVPLYSFEITEKPDYEFGTPSNNVFGDKANRMRLCSTSDVMIPTDGTYYHNTLLFLPPEKHLSEHPNWYYDYNNDGEIDQLCYTARGDEEEYESMMSAIMEKMKFYLAQTGCENATTISFTIMDNPYMCECDACMELYNKYQTHAGAVVLFVNDLAERVDKYLEDLAKSEGTKKREMNIVFFAYKETTQAPVKMVNGEYVPIDDSVRCRDNVGVFLAPINAYYTHSFYDEKNTQHAENVKKWANCSSKMYLWLYNTNFNNYFYAYNSFDATVETYRYCKNYNAVYMYNQGQFDQVSPTGFTVLKEYLNSKALWNVNYSTVDIYDKFFKGYFGEASVPMRRFFDEMQSHLKYVDEAFAMELPGGIYDVVNKGTYYSKVQLGKWLSYIEEAYEAIEPLKETDPNKYALYKKHITQESLYPRFLLIELFSGYYTSSALEEMKESFLADAEELKVAMYAEARSFSAYVDANW